MTDNGLGGVLRRRRVLLKNVCFLAVSVVALGYLGSDYADVGDWFGVHDYYTVNVELPQTGGLYPNADVTYRGVSVGRVGSISLTEPTIVVFPTPKPPAITIFIAVRSSSELSKPGNDLLQ